MSRFFDAQYAIAAQEIVRKHYNTKITTARIAMEVGVSERTLKRAFKNHFHIGIYEFQLKLRMEKAKELLECGGCRSRRWRGRWGINGRVRLRGGLRSIMGYRR